MISLRAYTVVEDAWQGGVADWCRGATAHVLTGGEAWLVATSDGQANWVKRRLLSEGTSVFGVRFLDARSLRRELCHRRGIAPSGLGRHTLELLLRLHATGRPALADVAVHPSACLTALSDYCAAGWLDDGRALFDATLPPALGDWVPTLRETGSWAPAIDRELLAATRRPNLGSPLKLCVFGWDASRWSTFELLMAAAKEAVAAHLFVPLPRGTSGEVQMKWVDALEARLGVERQDCEASDFASPQSALAARMEGVALDGGQVIAPDLLVGHDPADTVTLVRDFVARWLTVPSQSKERLAILCPGRSATSVAVVRALAEANIAVEDEIGELPEPSLVLQIQRAILTYHEDNADVLDLIELVQLLNDFRGAASDTFLGRIFPVNLSDLRRALHAGFGEAQHHDSRVLVETKALQDEAIGGRVRELVEHLGRWPVTLQWVGALERWEATLRGLGLGTAEIEPLWSRLRALPAHDDVPSVAFFQFLRDVLAGVPPRRPPGGKHRFARVVVTTLNAAGGQTWGGAVFLDSNEGSWPLYPDENPFLDDTERVALNGRRESTNAPRSYLLTTADRAQLEQFRFLEVLENCTGPVAFAGVVRDPADPAKELYANEWALRCLIASGSRGDEAKALLKKWSQSASRTRRAAPKLPSEESKQLGDVFKARRNPAAPFDEYTFNFSALAAVDEVSREDIWSGRDIEAVWMQPATFALHRILAAKRDDSEHEMRRRESSVVGRLVHAWLRSALHGSATPKRVTADDWRAALEIGIPAAQAATVDRIRSGLANGEGRDSTDVTPLPAWWRGTLARAEWIARRCVRNLAEAAQHVATDCWICMNRPIEATLETARGPLRLRTRCDVLLLDRPDLKNASGVFIDVHTGSLASRGGTITAQLQKGHGIGLGATFLLGITAGLATAKSRAGFIHQDEQNLAQWTAENSDVVKPYLEIIAAKQVCLNFGQSGALAGGPVKAPIEDLPLATTAIDPRILEAKAALSGTSAPTSADEKAD